MSAPAHLLTAKRGRKLARLSPSLTKYGRVLDKGHIPTSIFQTPVGKKHKDSGGLLTFGILLRAGMSSHGTNALPFLPQTGKKKAKTF